MALEDQNRSALRGWCCACIKDHVEKNKQVAHELGLGSSADHDLKSTAASSSQEAVVTPTKVSLCTWWQRVQREIGVSKQALRKWRDMTVKEKEDFKMSISDRLSPSPTSQAAGKLVKEPAPQTTNVETVEQFEKKWEHMRKELKSADSDVYRCGLCLEARRVQACD